MLKSKLHRACVTATEIDYEGSIAIDEDLLELVDIQPYEQVHIYNINSGSRFITYVIAAEGGSGTSSVNIVLLLLVLPPQLPPTSYACC